MLALCLLIYVNFVFVDSKGFLFFGYKMKINLNIVLGYGILFDGELIFFID